ncbi:MAG: DUF2187 domain-containing protein [Bavariicoccus seileri]|uniref:DUF2187 domain-containing protein n=1 Tax=Bavariicoccus seileri TaxID=549685 RepID=A0A3D4S7X3_9ENTE|nr:DUF2187 domain-containing protein [Bavariicoccus seileri]HCS94061.1 DUF2187 domain-containing protein [Bavariicoccus seileri]
MAKRITKTMRETVETELRKGTSKSRIAHLLDVPYDEAIDIISKIKESIRPEVGDEIRFFFREQQMVGKIEKLLTNSAVVKINWAFSESIMHDICEERTIVNFKDIDEFVVISEGEVKEKLTDE